ncbi:MAG: bacillithiol system redox-active protein YtxJ [Cyclobacteriaceae bacterium]
MKWNQLTDSNELQKAIELSKEKPVLLFKHSTRCSISSMALSRFERAWDTDEIEPYFLDLIVYRDISNEIASTLNVEHQSPQALLVIDGQCVHHASHTTIDFKALLEHTAA